MNGLSTAEFLSYLRSLNVKLSADRDRLRFNAPTGVLTPDLHIELNARKAEIVNFLREASLTARPQPPAIGWIPRGGEFPLSFAQARLWLLDQLEPGSSAYNIPAFFRFKGAFHPEIFEQSLTELVRRHEVLRTYYLIVDGRPIQRIAPPEPFRISVIDLQPLPQTARHKEAARLASVCATQPFDLEKAPLIRATLLKVAPDEHALLLDIHHIAFDGWSVGLLVQELSLLYAAFLHGKPSPLPELSIQYVDFAVWQRQWLQGKVLETQLNYWKERLTGNLPVLELPTNRPRPAVQTYNGGIVRFSFPNRLTDALTNLSLQEDVTLFVTLLSAFKVLLLRYTGQEDILVGTPIANRNHPEIEGLIGFFANTLVMRTDLSGNPTFRALLRRVHDVALEAYGHQDLPFERLVEELNPERDLSRTPIFQVLFSLLNKAATPIELPGLEPSWLEFQNGAARFDLTFSLEETAHGLSGGWSYNTDLFDQETIVRMAEHFGTLLEGIASGSDLRLYELPLLGHQEREQVLIGWNRTQAAYPIATCVHGLFEAQAKRTPAAIAVVFGRKELTYQELHIRSNRLANRLQALGVGPDVLVGICLERSAEIAVAVLGVLKAGGAYVPVDPQYPRDRVAFMIEDSGARVVITEEHLLDGLPNNMPAVVCIDRDQESLGHESEEQPASNVTPENLAYVIYTSGSTGKPKGVGITHRSVVNFLVSMRREPGLSEHDRLLAVTTLSFDIAGLEFYLPLTTGACVVVAPQAVLADGVSLAQLMDDSKITVMQGTPVTWRILLESGWKGTPGLKILCGGEAVPRELANRLLTAGAEVWNLYGPTETTIWSAIHRVDSRPGPVPIGKPIANTQVYVLDDHRQLVPRGVPGELYIGGDGLAKGYLHRVELTAERFVPNPFRPGEKLYRTGDLVRWLPDGNLEYIGRMDHQVKLRGFRIELGEIEAVIEQQPDIRQAVVLVREDVTNDQRLTAYVVGRSDQVPSVEELRRHLRQRLPDYMVPSVFVILPELPVTPNGKVDRKALPAPSMDRSANGSAYVAPPTEIEEKLAGIWAEILNVKQIGIYDNFFELGGHSLLAVALASKVERAFGKRLPLASFIHAPTIHQFSELLGQKTVRPLWSSLVKLSTGGSQPPFFLMHSHGGNVLEYHPLASRLGKERPVYALQARGLEGDSVEKQKIEEMATYYLKEIRSVQPHGPYHLGGYCLGGILALEVAQQLHAQDEEVGLLIMINTTMRGYPRYPPGTTRIRAALYGIASRLALEFDNLSHRPHRQMFSHVLARSRRVKDVLESRIEILREGLSGRNRGVQEHSMIYHLERLAMTIDEAAMAYRPSPYDGNVLLLYARQQPVGIIHDRTFGWEELLTGEFHVREVPGFRQNMLEEPNVEILASVVQDALRTHEISNIMPNSKVSPLLVR